MRTRAVKRFSKAPGWLRCCGLASAVALAASGCTHPKGAAAPSMSIQMTGGSATIVGGGKTQTVTDQAGLGAGYRVTVAIGGLAVLHLDNGRTFELTQGEALITGMDRIQLARGSALAVLTAHGEIDTEGLTVSSESGTFRVDAGISTKVGVLAGRATLAVPGESLDVPAFGEAVASAGVLPSSPRPLAILNGGDVWDHRFLQDAIDLDARLANFGGGLDAQLGNATGQDFFRLVVPNALALAYVQPFLSQPRSDVLIGLVLASSATASSQADTQTTFDHIMGNWLAGESWGLLAMEYHVSAQDVFAGLLGAIRKVGISLTTPTPRIAPIPVATPTPKIVALPKKTTPAAAMTTAPAATPTPTPSPTALLNQVLDPITNLLTQVLTLLLPLPTQTVTPAPTP